MSEYRSFGSNYHPSSQSRKISIGVMADSQPKRNPGPDEKGDEDVIARVEKLKSATVTELEASKKDKGVLAAKQRNAAKDTEHVTSPLRSPRSSYRKLGTLENVLCKQTSSSLGSKGLNKGLNGAAHQNFPVSNPQGSDGELNGSRNDKGMDRSPERMEEPSSAVLQQKVASQREEMDKPEKDKNGTTHALRSKLCEILGKASPENNEDVNSETPEVVKTNSKVSQDKGSNDDPLTKPGHNSDSIETDSECPENETRRPVTRSLLRRKVGANKGVQKKTKAGASAEKVNNIFSFEEGLHEKIGTAMNSSGMPKKPRGRGKNTVVQCRKVQRETSKNKTPPRSKSTRTGKRSLLSDKKGSSHELDPQKPDISTREEDFHPSPEAETAAATPEVFHGLSKNGDKQERPSNVFREKSAEPENEFQSSTFGYKAAISSLSPCFSPEASPLHSRNISPALDETEAPIFSFGTKKTSQRTTGKASDTERRSPDFLEKKEGYSFRKDSSAKPNQVLVMSDPSSDEESSGDESPALGHYNSPEERETANWSNEKSKREFSSAKRNSNLKGNGFSSAKRNSNLKGNGRVVLSPTSSLSKGLDKTDSFQRISERDEDVGLGRAVASFASSLENFEKKLKSGAKKKSSEIIASVSEEIHVELENVKSHIITEALDLTRNDHVEIITSDQGNRIITCEATKTKGERILKDCRQLTGGPKKRERSRSRKRKHRVKQQEDFLKGYDSEPSDKDIEAPNACDIEELSDKDNRELVVYDPTQMWIPLPRRSLLLAKLAMGRPGLLKLSKEKLSTPISYKELRDCLTEDRYKDVMETRSSNTQFRLHDSMGRIFIHWVTQKLDPKFLTSEETRKMIQKAAGFIRDQGDHPLCWAYVLCDMISASLVLHGLKDKYIPLSQLFLSQNIDKDEYERSVNKDSKDPNTHSCYMSYMKEALRFVEGSKGVPIATSGEIEKVFNCNVARPVSEREERFGITGVFRYTTLEEALMRLKTHPVAALLTCFAGWDKPGIYKGPRERRRYSGSHEVLMLDCCIMEDTMVVICKSSNGPDTGNNGYLYVSIEVMLTTVACTRTMNSNTSALSKPQYLLSDFYSIDMPIGRNPLLNETDEQKKENLKFKVDLEKEAQEQKEAKEAIVVKEELFEGSKSGICISYKKKRSREASLLDLLWLLLASVIFVPLLQKAPGGIPVLWYLAAGTPYGLSMIRNTLLVILETSLLTARAGLSMALGAFLAGLLLAETELSLQVESDIAPYRGLVLGLFFMTVGMLIDPKLLLSSFAVVVGTLGLLIVGKTVLVAFGEAVNQLSSVLFLAVGISVAVTPWLASGIQFIASRFKVHDVRSLLPALSKYYPNVKTFVRAHDVVHGLNLEKAGATTVVPETLEPSLQLAAAVLANRGN